MEQNQITPLTKREIVLETLAFYGMGGRFGYNSNTKICLYLDPETGNRCAVGRCLATDEYDDRQATVEELDPDFDSDFQPPYRGHSLYFWSQLQSAHDDAAQRDLSGARYALLHLGFEEEVEDPKFRLSYPAFFYKIT